MTIEVIKSTKVRKKATLTGEMIAELLGAPTNAAVEFHVPGGGDYSNMSLDVCEDCPVTVTWVE